MTAIKKLIDVSGNQYFPQTHTKAVVDDNGNSVESRMQAVQDVVNQAQMEIGAVPSDLSPTEGSTNWVTSGGVWNSVTSQEAVDLSIISTTNISSSSSNTWGDAYYGKYLPVAFGDEYIITTQSSPSIIVPLKTFINKPSTSYANDLAAGYSERVVISANTSYDFVVPSDCVCLYVQTTSGAGDITPSIKRIIRINKDESSINPNNDVFKLTHIPYSVDLELVSSPTWQVIATLQCYNNNQRGSNIYDISGYQIIRVTANSANAAYVNFLASLDISDYYIDATSCRYQINTNESADFVIPTGTRYLCVCSYSEAGNHLPTIHAYEKVLEKIDELVGKESQHFTISGAGQTTKTVSLNTQEGTIYKITLDNTVWSTSSISSGYVIFGITINLVYQARIVKGGTPEDTYFIRSTGGELRITARADSGSSVGFTIEDATAAFTNKIDNIHFVDNTTYMESMMVKIGNGDLIRYSLYADANSTPIKVYSRSVRDDTYLVDSVSTSEAGIISGEYMSSQDVFVVMKSVVYSGFTPFFNIFNCGNAIKGNITFPHQLIFKPENKVVLFSTTGSDVTEYDNGNINYAQIIPADGKYYMLYQAFGKTSHKSSNICMAYSDDGQNWTKGIPSGIEPPITGTNVIFDITNTGNTVNEFIGTAEVVNEFGVARVDDDENKYRMFCAIRNVPNPSGDSDGTIVGMCHYLLKSNDLVHWTAIRKIDAKPHDSFSCVISYGDKLKVYLRMWDYTQPADKQRMIGVMWLDIWGNVLVPASGIGGRGLYNPAAVRIGDSSDLLIPTHFWVNSGLMYGDDELETYIIENGNVRYAPSYNLDEIKDRSGSEEAYNGWCWGSGLVAIGMQQYFLCRISMYPHGTEVEENPSQICLIPVEWVTYDSYNTSGDVG